MPALVLKRTLVITLAGLIILAGLLVGGVRLLDHLAPQYRQALADRIGARIGATVSIEAIELRWHWRGPVLELADVRITRNGEQAPAMTLDSLGLRFSFVDLVQGQRIPDGLAFAAPRLAVAIGSDGRPRLAHWSRDGDSPLDWQAINRVRDTLRFVRIDNARLRLSAPQLPQGGAMIAPLDATLERGNDGLDWWLSAGGPEWFPTLTAEGHIEGALPEVRNARFQAHARDIDGPALARAVQALDDTLAARLSGGTLAIDVRGNWRKRQLESADVHLSMAALRDETRPQPLLPALSASLRATGEQRPGPGSAPIRFALSQIEGRDIEGLADLNLGGTLDLGQPAIHIEARQLPAAIGLRLARLQFPRLNDTGISANIDTLSFSAGASTPLALGIVFDTLHIDDPALTAGPLAGRYALRDGRHRLQFGAGGGTLSVPRFLRGDLAIDSLGGALLWQRADNAWQIEAQKLRLASGDAQVSASGRLRLPDDGAPIVALGADMSAPEVTRLLEHVPQAEDLPNARLRDWLPKAITAGRLQKARLEIAGALDRFPFAEPRDGERFHLEMTGSGVDVAYKPGWPPLHNARGQLTLDGDDLRVDLAAAEILGVSIAPSTGRVANVREPVLHVDGAVTNAPAEKMLGFLVASPLRDRFGKLVAALDFSGPADLALDLRIPLKPELGKPTVAGTIDAQGNTLRQRGLPGPITGIRGRVAFDKTGLRADNLSGDLLGVALSTDLKPTSGDSQRIVTHAVLRLPENAGALAHYLPPPWPDYGHGATDLRVTLQVQRSGEVSDIRVASDMTGLALTLPAPMAKNAAAAAPLMLQVAPDGRRVQMQYDRRLKLSAHLAEGKPRRIQMLLNDGGQTPPDQDGVWIGGQTPVLDAPDWYRLVRRLREAGERRGSQDDAGVPLAFIGGDLTVGRLRFDDRYFENSRIRAQPMNARRGWRIDFEGPNTQGQVTWTRPAGERVKIAGNLARMALKTSKRQASTTTDAEPSPVIWDQVSPLGLPRLDIHVANVSVNDADFGTARVQATALADGWQLDRATLENGALTGSAAGRWTRADGQTRAKAETHLEGHGLAGLLRVLGYPPAVRADTARVNARLSVAPNPNGLDLRQLDGHVELALDDGTLVSVEPGAARVLGLINLYVLPRRLRLDFRDVVDDGLAFDRIRARFNIENGNAYGDNVRIETPSSEIRIEGRIGLAARDYDERVTIMPKMGSGAAIAGTVLGGPLVGAAVLAAQELLKKPIQKFSSIGYTLKGSWDDPQIAEPRAEE